MNICSFFYEWGAPLQIMDDIMDLEDDIKYGHYAYPTLGFEEEFRNQPPAKAAAIIRSDKQHMRRLQIICQDLIDRSRTRCEQLDADLLLFFVNILEARLDQFFRIWITGAHVNSPGN